MHLKHTLALACVSALLAGTAAATSTASANMSFDFSYSGAVSVDTSSYETDYSITYNEAKSVLNQGASFSDGADYANSAWLTLNNGVYHEDLFAIAPVTSLGNGVGITVTQTLTVGAGGGTLTVPYNMSLQTGDAARYEVSVNPFITFQYLSPLDGQYHGNGAGLLSEVGNDAQSGSGTLSLDFAAADAPYSVTLEFYSVIGLVGTPPVVVQPPAPVPEPETWALMGLGAVGLVARLRLRNKAR